MKLIYRPSFSPTRTIYLIASAAATLPCTFSPRFFAMTSPTGSLKRKADDLPSSKPAQPKQAKTNASITSFFGAPKAAAGTQSNGASAPTVKFDKAKWVAKLSPEQKSLLKLEIDTLDESWLAHLKDDVTTPSFLGLKRFLKSEVESGKKIFPPMEDVYSW